MCTPLKKKQKTLQQQNCVTPLRKFKGQKPRLLKIPYDLFLIPLEIPCCFSLTPEKSNCYYFFSTPENLSFI